MKLMKSKLFLSVCAALIISGCKAETTSTTNVSQEGKPAMTAQITELQKIDTQVGTGREAEVGFNVTVHYTGWLYDPTAEGNKGKKFDSSVDRKEPFNFFLGGQQVIQGWDEGFAGMKIGGKRHFLAALDVLSSSLCAVRLALKLLATVYGHKKL
jgi:FKBP-type peptidyl-prolyl cis-trans isomerase FkpA